MAHPWFIETLSLETPFHFVSLLQHDTLYGLKKSYFPETPCKVQVFNHDASVRVKDKLSKV